MTAASTEERPARVVLVDDTEDVRVMVRTALEKHRQFHIVGEAADGRAGVEVARRERPDLVVLDLDMPVMDGADALVHLRRDLPDTKVVILSSSDAARTADWARSAGAWAYLQKGVPLKRIVSTACAALGIAEVVPVRADVADGPEAPPARDPSGASTAELDRVHAALAGAAHELRGPATVLLAMTELLSSERDSLDPGTFHRMIDAIQRQAHVLDRVTGDLLTSTQSQRGVLTVDVEPTLLRPLVDSAALGVASRIALHIDCDPRLWVVADPTRVQQMLGNLVSNALKYGAAPIAVTVHQQSGDAYVRVTDHGAGVPPEFRPRLFGQFSRAHGARVNGMGLGLFVVRSLAEVQGGRAWYEPLPEGGSAFCFTLPTTVGPANVVSVSPRIG